MWCVKSWIVTGSKTNVWAIITNLEVFVASRNNDLTVNLYLPVTYKLNQMTVKLKVDTNLGMGIITDRLWQVKCWAPFRVHKHILQRFHDAMVSCREGSHHKVHDTYVGANSHNQHLQ